MTHHTQKHIELTGSSEVGTDDAINNAIEACGMKRIEELSASEELEKQRTRRIGEAPDNINLLIPKATGRNQRSKEPEELWELENQRTRGIRELEGPKELEN